MHGTTYTCCVRGCGSFRPNKRDHRLFHSFPSNPEQRAKWIEAVGALRKKDITNMKKPQICSLHFEKDFYRLDAPHMLVLQAIPTIFPAEKDIESCIISNCQDKIENIQYNLFKFPQNLERREKWIEAIGTRASATIDQVDKPQICGQHFSAASFTNTERSILRRNAVPCFDDNILKVEPQEEVKFEVPRTCRMCLGCKKGAVLYPLFSEGTKTLLKMISELFGIEAEITDEFYLICETCIVRIDLAYSIRKDFLAANARFKRKIHAEINIVKIEALPVFDEETLPEPALDEGPVPEFVPVLDETFNFPSMDEIPSVPEPVQIDETNMESEADVKPPVKKKSNQKKPEAHKCYFCNRKIFDSLEKLEEHLKGHDDDIPFDCMQCTVFSFFDPIEANKHQALHDPTRTYKCRSCDYRFHWHYHRRTHERRMHKELQEKKEVNQEIKCYICNKLFDTTLMLEDHLKIHFDEMPYHCKICVTHKKLICVTETNKHMGMHDENRRYKCRYCEVRFFSAPIRSSHERRIHVAVKKWPPKSFQCPTCGNIFTNSQAFKRHEASHLNESKKYDCPYCDVKISNKINLNRHKRQHTGEKPYKCHLCEAAFNQNTSLQRHMDKHKDFSKVEKVECAMCERTFISEFKLKSHMYHTHKRNTLSSGQKSCQNPVKCIFCQKSFTTTNQLIKHLNIDHSEMEIQYLQCDKCDKKLPNEQTMLKHHRESHNEKFKCQICDRCCSSRTHLRNHLAVHTDEKTFSCEICQQTFKHHTSIKRHMLVHQNIRNFVCDICDKAFAQRTTLQNHRRTHTGEKPHECPVCKARFGDQGTFYKHKKIHNKN